MPCFKWIVSLLLFVSSGSLQAVKADCIQDEDSVFNTVETQIKFNHGGMSFTDFIIMNVKYPDSCRENGISGKMLVQFVVNKEGRIDTAFVVGNVPVYKQALAREAIRVVMLSSGKWTPAFLNGRPVKSYARIPILFELE
jgi:protein TonB